VNKLEEICAHKRDEVADRKARTGASELAERAAFQTPPRGFRKALEAAPGFGLIAEIKKASRSCQILRSRRRGLPLRADRRALLSGT
jgi:indole-3-glycerol phosphate synthase